MSRLIPEYTDGYGYLRVKVPVSCRECKYRMKIFESSICTEYSKHNITNIDMKPIWCPIMNEKEIIARYGNGFNSDR